MIIIVISLNLLMTFCFKCGGELPENTTYCPKCGTLVVPGAVPHRRSRLWFILPIFFQIIGGVIAYFIVKNDDPPLAKYCLLVGAILTAINVAFFLMSMTFWHMSWMHDIDSGYTF